LAAEEAIVAAKAEEGTEEAIEDKNKFSHRSIGGNNMDEGFDSGSGEILATAAPAGQRWLRRGGGAVARKFQ